MKPNKISDRKALKKFQKEAKLKKKANLAKSEDLVVHGFVNLDRLRRQQIPQYRKSKQ